MTGTSSGRGAVDPRACRAPAGAGGLMSRASQPALASPGRRKGPPLAMAAHTLAGCGIGSAAAGALAPPPGCCS
jgi:hypothetical protein